MNVDALKEEWRARGYALADELGQVIRKHTEGLDETLASVVATHGASVAFVEACLRHFPLATSPEALAMILATMPYDSIANIAFARAEMDLLQQMKAEGKGGDA